MRMSIRPAPALPAFAGAPLWLMACLVAVARLIPHPWNFTPIGGFALFCGHAAPGWQRYAAPLFAVLVADLVLGLYHPLVMLAVYTGHLLSAAVGRWMLAGRVHCTLGRTAGAAALASLPFFALSNLASWWTLYSHDLAGFSACLVAALPFFQATLLGNVLFGCMFVKGYAWLAQRRMALS